MKYIDAEDLQVIIEKRINNIESCPFIEAEFGAEMRREGKILAYNDILTLIDSLQQEQTEVDLEKEYKEYVEDDPVFSKLTNRNVGFAIARHFYELGQLEMRHRITNPEYNAKVVEQLKSEYPARKEEK